MVFYKELFTVYVMILVLAVLLVAVIVLQCIILKKLSNIRKSSSNSTCNNIYTNSGSIAVCRNCATQYDSSQTFCPKCGTSR